MNGFLRCCWMSGTRLYSERFMHSLCFRISPRNEDYISFYACLQCRPLPISVGTLLCWSGLCARLWMSLWISFSLCDDLPVLLLLQYLWTERKLIFFVQKWQSYSISWPSGHAICFSVCFFQSGCHLDVVFCFFNNYHRIGLPSANKVCMYTREICDECRL